MPADVRHALAFALGCAGMTACGPPITKVEETHWAFQQSLIEPAPGGAPAVGPLVPEGHVALEGTLGKSLTLPALSTRMQGAPGDRLAISGARGRVALGISKRTELSVEGERFSGAALTPTASDMQPLAAPSADLFTLGTGGRTTTPGPQGIDVEVFWELTGTLLDLAQTYQQEIDTTEWAPDGQATTSTSGFVAARDFHVYSVNARGGLALRHAFGPWSVSGGGLLQTTSTARGHWDGTWTCTWVGNDDQPDCDGSRPSPAPRVSTAVIGTAFAALSLRVGPTVITGQVYGHGPSTTSEIGSAAPVGGELGLRWEL